MKASQAPKVKAPTTAGIGIRHGLRLPPASWIVDLRYVWKPMGRPAPIGLAPPTLRACPPTFSDSPSPLRRLRHAIGAPLLSPCQNVIIGGAPRRPPQKSAEPWLDPFPKRKDLIPVTVEFPPEAYRELERVVANEASTMESAIVWSVEVVLAQHGRVEENERAERERGGPQGARKGEKDCPESQLSASSWRRRRSAFSRFTPRSPAGSRRRKGSPGCASARPRSHSLHCR